MNASQARNDALSFGLASERCMEQRLQPGGTFQMLAIPAIACAAFSIELGLKSLLLLDKKRARGHNLSELFGVLHPDVRDSIARRTGAPCASFEAELRAVANAFNAWRYLFEKDSANIDAAFLFSLMNAVNTECKALVV